MNGLYVFIGAIVVMLTISVAGMVYLWKSINENFREESENPPVMGHIRSTVRELADEAKSKGKIEVSKKAINSRFGKGG